MRFTMYKITLDRRLAVKGLSNKVLYCMGVWRHRFLKIAPCWPRVIVCVNTDMIPAISDLKTDVINSYRWIVRCHIFGSSFKFILVSG